MKDVSQLIFDSLQNLDQEGTRTVSIPKGTYYVDHSILLQDLYDVTIDGGDSTIIFTNAENSGIELLRGNRVTLCNLKIDYDPLPYTQGVIVGMDPQGSWYDLQIDAGYRRDPEFFLKDLGGDLNFHIFDPVTRKVKRDSDTISPKNLVFLREDLVRIEMEEPRAAWMNVQVGDLAATSGSWCGVAVRLLHCAYTKLFRVTIYTSGGAGIMERFGYGAADLSFCITRGEKPKGATAERLFSTPRDGFHTTGTVQGAHVHDSLVEYNGDDGLNFWSFFFRVDAIDRPSNGLEVSTILGDVGKDPLFWQAGERANVYDGKTAAYKGTVTVVHEDGLHLQVSETDWIEPGDFLNCPDRVARSALVENNTFRNIDGIGMLLKSPGAIARHNYIESVAHAGIWIGCYLGGAPGEYMEGPFPEDLLITDNTIVDTGFSRLCRSDWFQASSAIHIGHVTPLREVKRQNREMKHITLQNNLIRTAATFGILVSNAQDVTLSNNFIMNTNCDNPFHVQEELYIEKNGAIVIKASEQIRLAGNTVSCPGAYCETELFMDA